MTINPFQINQMMQTYNRGLKLKPGTLFEKENPDPKDVVMISSEAKKKQILEEARGAVLERIRQGK